MYLYVPAPVSLAKFRKSIDWDVRGCMAVHVTLPFWKDPGYLMVVASANWLLLKFSEMRD